MNLKTFIQAQKQKINANLSSKILILNLDLQNYHLKTFIISNLILIFKRVSKIHTILYKVPSQIIYNKSLRIVHFCSHSLQRSSILSLFPSLERSMLTDQSISCANTSNNKVVLLKLVIEEGMILERLRNKKLSFIEINLLNLPSS